jgi:hypothetical protein
MAKRKKKIEIGQKIKDYTVIGIISPSLFAMFHVSSYFSIINSGRTSFGPEFGKTNMIFVQFETPRKQMTLKELSVQNLELTREELEVMYASYPEVYVMYLPDFAVEKDIEEEALQNG